GGAADGIRARQAAQLIAVGLHRHADARPRSALPVAIADAVEGLDLVELDIDLFELLAQALDMTVDGPVIDIDVLAIGGVHQLVPVLDVTGTMGQGLQQQELGYRQIDRPALPVAEMARRVKQQIAALDDLARRTGRSRLALAQALAAQQGPDALDEQALREGLLDVVVGPHAQAHELIDLVIL